MNDRDKKTIQRILKVNHAGEYGAIRIYKAQLWVARKRNPDLVDFLEDTLNHEIEHCALFAKAMPERQTRPCRIMSLWGNGGYVLGFLTAILGSQSIWICTSAVEEAVHKHLEDQLRFLRGKDENLVELIDSIKEEELGHLSYANSKIIEEGRRAKFLRMTISLATEILIVLSTWGDSIKMSGEFRQRSDARS
jgi:ubiquinone biosynthesis monooxygenase Coq7